MHPTLRPVLVLLALAALISTAWADLSSVRYEKSGRGHHYLSTANPVPAGDRQASLNVYLLAGRYVAAYSESKRIDATRSEVLVERELTGAVSGDTLANLGGARLLAQQHNGKPVVELTLGQAVGALPRGTVIRLVWVYGSWAPPSVTR